MGSKTIMDVSIMDVSTMDLSSRCSPCICAVALLYNKSCVFQDQPAQNLALQQPCQTCFRTWDPGTLLVKLGHCKFITACLSALYSSVRVAVNGCHCDKKTYRWTNEEIKIVSAGNIMPDSTSKQWPPAEAHQKGLDLHSDVLSPWYRKDAKVCAGS